MFHPAKAKELTKAEVTKPTIRPIKPQRNIKVVNCGDEFHVWNIADVKLLRSMCRIWGQSNNCGKECRAEKLDIVQERLDKKNKKKRKKNKSISKTNSTVITAAPAVDIEDEEITDGGLEIDKNTLPLRLRLEEIYALSRVGWVDIITVPDIKYDENYKKSIYDIYNNELPSIIEREDMRQKLAERNRLREAAKREEKKLKKEKKRAARMERKRKELLLKGKQQQQNNTLPNQEQDDQSNRLEKQNESVDKKKDSIQQQVQVEDKMNIENNEKCTNIDQEINHNKVVESKPEQEQENLNKEKEEEKPEQEQENLIKEEENEEEKPEQENLIKEEENEEEKPKQDNLNTEEEKQKKQQELLEEKEKKKQEEKRLRQEKANAKELELLSKFPDGSMRKLMRFHMTDHYKVLPLLQTVLSVDPLECEIWSKGDIKNKIENMIRKRGDRARRRCAVIEDLWSKGYYYTEGARFGCDFLAYSGPPSRFHSAFMVWVSSPDDHPLGQHWSAIGRVATASKKMVLMAMPEPKILQPGEEYEKISYLSFKWNPVFSKANRSNQISYFS